MRLVKFYCPTHGWLCDAPDDATVFCGQSSKDGPRKRRCNKRATTTKPERKAAA